MRKIILAATMAAMMGGGYYTYQAKKHKPLVQVLFAQSFPFALHVEFNPNPTADQVTSYSSSLDGGTVSSIPPTVVSSCNCIKTPVYNINDSNLHTISVTATNLFGTSTPTSVQFIVKVPNAPASGTVKPGA